MKECQIISIYMAFSLFLSIGEGSNRVHIRSFSVNEEILKMHEFHVQIFHVKTYFLPDIN
jgi:hypothetical protein